MIPDALYGRRAIAWLARFWRDRTTLLGVVLAGLGTAHILVRTAPYGAAIDPHSIVFLSTALNFLAGEGWRDLVGDPMVLWPPLFPLLLAAFGWVGIEPLEAGRWVNAAAFGLTILVVGGWLRSHLRSQWLVLAATATIAASLPLSDLASRFMTEPLFVLFTVLALMQLAAFLNRRTDAPLWWAAVFTALAALTRYPGVVLIGTGVLVLLVRRAPPLAARLKHAVVFGAVSSMPLAGVLTRNWAVSGTLTGERIGSGQSLSDWLSRVADVFREWVIPPNAPDGLGYLLLIAAGLVVLAAGAVVGRSGRNVGRGGKSSSFGLGPVLPFGGFAVAYFVFSVAVMPLVTSPCVPRPLPAAGICAVAVDGGVAVGPIFVHRGSGPDGSHPLRAGVPRRAGHSRPRRLLGAQESPSYRPSLCRYKQTLVAQHRLLAPVRDPEVPPG